MADGSLWTVVGTGVYRAKISFICHIHKIAVSWDGPHISVWFCFTVVEGVLF